MFFKGVELTNKKTVKYCTEYYCSKSIPLCCICISQYCSENSCKWFHISSGEHICTVCYNRIQSFFSYEKDCNEIYRWKQTWLKQSHENSTSIDFIIGTLMPMWCLCSICKKWRQVNRDVRLTPFEISTFQCSHLIKHSNNPCHVPEDNRIDFIKKNPQDFFGSLKYQPLLETVPFLDIYEKYSFDIVGISPTANVVDFSLYTCPDFMTKFNPFMKRSKFEMTAGSIDPSCMDIWEHEMFPMFCNNFRSIFIGLRNLILVLWAADPKRVVDEALLSQCTLVHGLVRVALLLHVVPDMLRVYSGLGYINYGFVDPGPYSAHIFEEHGQTNIVVINTNLSGLVAAKHLRELGANVTVIDINKPTGSGTSNPLRILDINPEVYGFINNPLVVAAYQLGIEMREINPAFTIFNYDGHVISDEVDNYFQSFVYGFVDFIIEESNKSKNSNVECFGSLQELYDIYREKEFDIKYKDNVNVQEVYLAEIEYRIFGGAPLHKVSKQFDLSAINRRCTNFDMRQYSGGNMEVVNNNWNVLREKLTEGCKSEMVEGVGVMRVGEKYEVTLSDGRKYEGDKVVISVDPWEIGRIRMGPGIVAEEEGERKKDELEWERDKVGGRLFVVRMLFRQGRAFWRREPGQCAGTFAMVPRKGEERGFCHLFVDSDDSDGNIVLQSRIFGAASAACHTLMDGDIVSRVLRKLSCLSRNANGASPRPYGYEVHRHEHALCTATRATTAVTEQCASSIYVNQVPVTSGDAARSVSSAFASGLHTATSMVRDVLSL